MKRKSYWLYFFVLVLTVFSFDLKATESVSAADCNGACLQTLEWALIDPEVSEFKFYGPGIGVILAYDLEEPEVREELLEIYMLD